MWDSLPTTSISRWKRRKIDEIKSWIFLNSTHRGSVSFTQRGFTDGHAKTSQYAPPPMQDITSNV